MKKTLILMLCAVVLLSLSACGGDAPKDALQTPSQGAAEALPNRSAPPAAPYDPAQSSQADTGAAPAVSGAEAVDEEPFGQYRSVEELLAILDGTAEDDRAEPLAVFENGEIGEISVTDMALGYRTSMFKGNLIF